MDRKINSSKLELEGEFDRIINNHQICNIHIVAKESGTSIW